MRNRVKITVAAMLAVGALSSPAQIIISPTLVTYQGQSGGVTLPNYQLAITYGVTESAGLYTYSYTLVTTPGEPMLSLTIGGNVDPVYTQSAALLNTGSTDTLLDGFTSNAIIFGWDLNPGTTSDSVSFTSLYGPTFATFTLNDDDILWTSPNSIPAPTPAVVPEAPTILSGAMMVLPFGVAAFRALRKERKVSSV